MSRLRRLLFDRSIRHAWLRPQTMLLLAGCNNIEQTEYNTHRRKVENRADDPVKCWGRGPHVIRILVITVNVDLCRSCQDQAEEINSRDNEEYDRKLSSSSTC